MKRICNLPEQVAQNTEDIEKLEAEVIVINGEITDLYDFLSNLPDISGFYTKEETDALLLTLQTEIDNIEPLSSKVVDDTDTNITDGINYYLHQTDINTSDISGLEELTYANSQESFNGDIDLNLTELNTTDDPLRFDLFKSGGEQIFEFVKINTQPNTFTFIKKGKLSFIMKFENLENTALTDTRIELDLWKNGELTTTTLGFNNKYENKFGVSTLKLLIEGEEGDVFYYTIQAVNDVEDATIIFKKSVRFTTYFYESLDYYVDKESYEIDNELITEAIDENTNAITTLNGLVSANFETFGRYQIGGTSIDDGDGEVQFNLAEVIPLDPDFITVSEIPNNFINLQQGKITFNIIADGIINDGATNLTLSLRIYLNGLEIDQQPKVVEAGKTVSVNYANVLTVEDGDVVYATLEITTGTGTLSTLNPVIINIDFNTSGDVNAVKSSQIIDDTATLPDNGINPLLNQINTLLPIGMIVLAPTAPQVGTWTDLGLLNTGQTIIGGADSNGEVISHNHQWLINAKRKSINGGGDASPIVSLTSFDINQNNTTIEYISGNGGVTNYDVPLYTNKTGTTQNKAYGIGVGTTIHIWRRES